MQPGKWPAYSCSCNGLKYISDSILLEEEDTVDEFMVAWSKFDYKAKTHWWRGTFDGLVFYIEKDKANFYYVTLEGEDKIHEPWERQNTLREAKQWTDDWLCTPLIKEAA